MAVPQFSCGSSGQELGNRGDSLSDGVRGARARVSYVSVSISTREGRVAGELSATIVRYPLTSLFRPHVGQSMRSRRD